MPLAQESNIPDVAVACELLDKIMLKQLHLIEEKMQCEINIESNINNGSIHLAKSRYIMGQSSVSTARLPTESSPDFSASTVCESREEDGVQQLKVLDKNTETMANPLRWFGILVPQNLHKAQHIFQNTISYVVDCANIQLQICSNMKNIEALKNYISSMKSV